MGIKLMARSTTSTMTFPARELIRQWLKAGYMEEEEGTLHGTETGTPQGGVITPPTRLQK
jgi:RNA-directed DNA polymerase